MTNKKFSMESGIVDGKVPESFFWVLFVLQALHANKQCRGAKPKWAKQSSLLLVISLHTRKSRKFVFIQQKRRVFSSCYIIIHVIYVVDFYNRCKDIYYTILYIMLSWLGNAGMVHYINLWLWFFIHHFKLMLRACRAILKFFCRCNALCVDIVL